MPRAAEQGGASTSSAVPPNAAPAGPGGSAEPADQPPQDKSTHLFRQTPEPPTFPLRALPDPEGQEPRDAMPTFRLRAVPEWVAEAAPGTVVAPPTGQFGPPPVMDAPVTDVPPADAPPTDAKPETAPRPTPTPRPEPGSGPVATSEPVPTPGAAPTSGAVPTSGLAPASGPAPAPARKPILGFTASTPVDEPDPKPTPPRGFDAVAEAVLGDDPATAYDGGGTVFLAGPMARINEAVKAGRVTEAAQLAEQTVGEASHALGPDHPEVLRLLELTAYIAYLAGDPARAFGLSLDLARARHHARDTEAAYGNIQSAATAWRAVRDPEQGLRMGVDLIDLWTELSREGGAAAEDIEQLESARTRMGRLAERARKLDS
ncbi:tetratricopeptide repeat protein [Streptomyces sp. NPDC021056]|uniref:tetratricopeptide repeat protein n=1 Tax=Streptomyces sp. NPDC021056 TaxID=3155012 RepID=UPI0033DB4957